MPQKELERKSLKNLLQGDIENKRIESIYLEFENLPYILKNTSCITNYYQNVNINISSRLRTVNEEKVERTIYTIDGLKDFVWNDIIQLLLFIIYVVKLDTQRDVEELHSFVTYNTSKQGNNKVYGFMIINEMKEEYEKIASPDYYKPYYVKYNKDWENVKKLIRKLVQLLGAVEANCQVSLTDNNSTSPAFTTHFMNKLSVNNECIRDSKKKEMLELIEYKENIGDIYSREYYAAKVSVMRPPFDDKVSALLSGMLSDYQDIPISYYNNINKITLDKLWYINSKWNKGIGVFSLKEYACFMHRILLNPKYNVTYEEILNDNNHRVPIDQKYFVAFIIPPRSDKRFEFLKIRFPNMSKYLVEGSKRNEELIEESNNYNSEIKMYEYEHLVMQINLL